MVVGAGFYPAFGLCVYWLRLEVVGTLRLAVCRLVVAGGGWHPAFGLRADSWWGVAPNILAVCRLVVVRGGWNPAFKPNPCGTQLRIRRSAAPLL